MVRDVLLAQTASHAGSLAARAERAKEVAAAFASAFAASGEHPYAQLMAREFRFVCDGHPSYVAHEFLAPHNRAYWRSELATLAAAQGLTYVADADFNRPSGTVPPDLESRIAAAGLAGPSLDDTVDFLSYRQLHSPILTRLPWTRHLPTMDQLVELAAASCLEPNEARTAFRHPSGFEVEARDDDMAAALASLRPLWPRARRIAELFARPESHVEDLLLLHRHGLLELQLVEDGSGEGIRDG
jgi:hypothetical protein